jgi:hypothetical protein
LAGAGNGAAFLSLLTENQFFAGESSGVAHIGCGRLRIILPPIQIEWEDAMRLMYRLVSACALLASASTASATIVDPAGDLLATYTGPVSSGVDITSGDVAFDGTSFLFTATVAGNIDATPGQLYAWGINRGAGTPRLDLLRDPDIAPGILFDAVLVMLPNGFLSVVTIPVAGAPTATNFATGTTISGDTLSASVPLSLLFPTGFAPEDYTFGFWSRIRVDPTVDGTNNEIADFLQGSGALNARAVPEPATWLTMLLGFGLVGGAIRSSKRRNRQLSARTA